MTPTPAPLGDLPEVMPGQAAVLAASGVPVDSSPSQARLNRIAAMLRDAERAAPIAADRERRGRRGRGDRQMRPAA